MNEHNRYLRIALVVVGIAFLLIYPLTKIWPSGWVWQPDQSESLQMIIGVYATLGIFLLRAARKPEDHLSLIWFTIWSSLVHGSIMAVQAVTAARTARTVTVTARATQAQALVVPNSLGSIHP